jgi:signal transduction histidine kinase
LNLVSNAIKFSPPDSTVKVITDLTKSDHPNMCKLIVKVLDRGIGVPQSEEKLFFKAFFKSKEKNILNESNTSGRGLGLFISSQICKKLKG